MLRLLFVQQMRSGRRDEGSVWKKALRCLRPSRYGQHGAHVLSLWVGFASALSRSARGSSALIERAERFGGAAIPVV